MRNHLYLRLYAALLASALVCLMVAGIAFRTWSRAGGSPVERLHAAAEAIDEQTGDAPEADVREVLARIGSEYSVHAIVGDEEGPRVGFPSPLAFPWPRRLEPGLHRDRGGPMLVAPLRDGKVAVLRAPGPPYRQLRLHPFFATLLILAVVMAVGSYPVARRVARRLEALAEGVESWGRGALERRVAVEGRDEIARLATTFNQAAERVSVLLEQQKQMLANASHELRSPLARLRMALELMAEEPDGARRRSGIADIHRDIVELDGLIEEILLFARADSRVPGRPLVAVDMARLCAAEAERTGARFESSFATKHEREEIEPGRKANSAATLLGDETLLRHMIRNLLENAERHGGGEDVRISIAPAPGTPPPGSDGPVSGSLVLRVEDGGPGIPMAERERIFAPFYRPPRKAIATEATATETAAEMGTTGRRGGTAAKGAAGGHGVGLALVRQVARYHGGTAVYHPRPGGGSAFEITLPRGGS